MQKLRTLILAGLSALGCLPLGLHAAEQDWPSYHPATPTASLELRRESWDELSLEISRTGSLVLDGEKLVDKNQRRYFEDAQAAEALALLDKREAARHSAARWMVLAPLGMTALGAGVAYASSTVESSRTGTGYSDSDAFLLTVFGGAVGLAAGAVIGVPMGLYRIHQGTVLDAQAAKSFNHKLLQDLRLDALPIPGGATLGVSGRF